MFRLFKKKENLRADKQIVLDNIDRILNVFDNSEKALLKFEDNQGNLVVQFELTNMSVDKSDIRDFKQSDSNRIHVEFEKVRYGWRDAALTWEANKFAIDLPASIGDDFSFRKHLAKTMTIILAQDMARSEDLYDLDLLENIGLVSESELNNRITVFQFFHRLYTTMGAHFNVKYDVFQQKVREKLLSAMVDTVSHGVTIPTHVVEFLMCMDKMIPCMHTLDDVIYVLGKDSARPFIFKRENNRFVRTDIFDTEYKRYLLANQLEGSTQ